MIKFKKERQHHQTPAGDVSAGYVAKIEATNADLLAALEGSWQYLVAWRFEYADKPNDEHNNAQRDRIDAQIRKVEAVIAKAKDGKG